MQAPFPPINPGVAPQTHKQSDAAPLSTLLLTLVRWVRNVHLVSLPLIIAAPILFAPAFDGVVVAPFFIEWVQALLRPMYDYYPYWVQLQAASFLISLATAVAVYLLAERGVHWLGQILFWLLAGLTGISAVAVLLPLGVVGLLVGLTLLLWLIAIVIGFAVGLGGLAIVLGLLCLVATVVVFAALINAGRQNVVYEEYPPPYPPSQYPYRGRFRF